MVTTKTRINIEALLTEMDALISEIELKHEKYLEWLREIDRKAVAEGRINVERSRTD